jgi:protein arginine kinase
MFEFRRVPHEKQALEALMQVGCKTQISLVRNLANEPFPLQMKTRAAIGLGRDLAQHFCSYEGAVDLTHDAYWREVVGPRYGLSSPEERSPGYRLVRVAFEGDEIWIEIMSANHLTFSLVGEAWDLVARAERLQRFVTLVGRQLAFAYDEKLGFVATQVSLIGTGLRIRTWMHLNALSRYHLLPQLANAMEALGIYVEMEEERLPDGHLYILFNRGAIQAPVQAIVAQFCEGLKLTAWHEMNARYRFVHDHPYELRDLLDGILALCAGRRLFSEREASFILSDLQMARSVKVFTGASLKSLFAFAPWFLVMQEALLPHLMGAKTLEDWVRQAPPYFARYAGMQMAFCRGMWLRKYVKFTFAKSFLKWYTQSGEMAFEAAEKGCFKE